MQSPAKHLVFYDGACGLCDQVVQLLLRIDRREIFCFAPLQGETAKSMLQDLSADQKQVDSLILVENFRTPEKHYFLMGKGALRICWLIGRSWALLGWISFLPSWLYDWAYRLVAKNRRCFFRTTVCVVPDPANSHRFLP